MGQQAETEKATTHVIKAKCLGCQLHFQLYTWRRLWLEKHTLHCPECGSTESFMIWQEPVENLFIYELVPGRTPLVAWGPTPMGGVEGVLDDQETSEEE